MVADCPVFPLGLGDHITPRTLATEVMFMYPPPPSTSTSTVVEVMPFTLLRASLSYVLSWWPLLCGRVVQDGKTGRMSVLVNDIGCVWVEAEARGLTVSDIGHSASSASGRCGPSG